MPKENRNPDRNAPTVTNDLLAELVALATETNRLLGKLLEPYTTDDIGPADDDAGDDDAGDDGKTKAKADAKTKAAAADGAGTVPVAKAGQGPAKANANAGQAPRKPAGFA